ncbi:hypothetical protein IWW55_004621, partial [Coemansia sp. RSA 2706]
KVFSEHNETLNGKASAVIFGYISDSLGSKFISATAHEMWSGLSAMFELQTTSSMISELRDLVNLKMESDDDNPIQYWYSSLTKWNDFCSHNLDLRTA